MNKLIKLTPYYSHNIWGGTRLKEDFGYDVEGSDIGECWGISAHPDGESVVASGEYEGFTLSELWTSQPELFGNKSNDGIPFPLLVKIIDAHDDLSIQVHPDDTYAKEHENGSLGKMECWYILDCEKDSTLVIGHNAKSKDELKEMINNSRWNEFISEIPVKKGDFIQINPGTVHAIKGGILLLETQQSSNITYRVYDYDRLQNGKPRELHVDKSIDVIKVPAEPISECVKKDIIETYNELNMLYDCKYYTVYVLNIKGECNIPKTVPYMLMTVVDGEGKACGEDVKKGIHFIVTADCDDIEMSGDMKIICSIAKS